MSTSTVIVRQLGLKDYLTTWQAMQQFTQARRDETLDEIWLLEHTPVITQGQNGKPEHILSPVTLPIIQVDRGGQVTYHGPGQLVIYTLIDLKRKKWNVRQMVSALEQSIIDCLKTYRVDAYAETKAPGIYVDKKKIASIGLRIRRGCSFHGLAINIKMDLDPFTLMHPCGFKELEMTQLSAFTPIELDQVRKDVIEHLIKNLGFIHYITRTEEWYG